jgi:hypothetical protein
MRLVMTLAILSLVGCGGRPRPAERPATKPAAANDRPGSYDDLTVADDDLAGLERLLNAKWTYFVIEMDKYNQARTSAGNDAMAKRMQKVFAEQFEFRAYYPDGAEFGTTQGTYTPRSWLEAQKVDTWNLVRGTLLVPSYLHVLRVEEPGKRVVLEGYHEHLFVGAGIRLAIGEARQLAFDVIVFEKLGGVWRITSYRETVWSASEVPARPRRPDRPPLP